jgi:hypothetical protein
MPELLAGREPVPQIDGRRIEAMSEQEPLGSVAVALARRAVRSKPGEAIRYA